LLAIDPYRVYSNHPLDGWLSVIVGVSAALATLIFFIVKMVLGNSELLIPIFFIIAYIAYIFSSMVEEYKICMRDEEAGVHEAIMEFYDFKIIGRGSKHKNLVMYFATFKEKGNDNYITLNGDFTKVELVKGKEYRIVFYKNSRILLHIESV